LCVSQLMHDLCRNLLILHRQPSASQPHHLPVNLDGSQSTWTQLPANLIICLCQSTWSSASQPGRQPVNLAPAASQPGHLPVNLDGSQSTWPAASHPDQQPVNLASSQSTWPGASSAIRTEHGRPPVMSTEVSTVKSGDIHYWSVDHHRYNICTLTSVITEEFL